MGGGKERALETADQGLQFRPPIVFAGKVFTMAELDKQVLLIAVDLKGKELWQPGGDWQWNGFWGTHVASPTPMRITAHLHDDRQRRCGRDEI